jgi:N,N'-diacetylchitobiose phosphorylase
MRFGYFDDQNREYVIERPDTPRPWSNYLGDITYGAIITNNAGGYSFFHSAAQGRFMRLRFNAIPMDQPGRYIYLHDRDRGDFWSASWQPVGKPLKDYRCECRHGTAYTRISSSYSGIETRTLYFVPLGRHFECWKLNVTNTGTGKRRISLFTFVEYAGHWLMWNDLVNLQYSQYIVRMNVEDNIIDHGVNVFIPQAPDDFQKEPQARHTFLTVVNGDIKGFDTDRDGFIGPYRTYANPLVVERGQCTNSLAAGDNGCGTIQIDIELNPGETRELVVLMGIGRAGIEGKKIREEFSQPGKVQKEFETLKQYWHSMLEGLTVDTPDPELNSMMNMWNPYNSLITYAWSRAASLIYSGERDGLGYRDTVQDLLGVIHNIPEQAGERLKLMLTGQCSSGGAMPVVKPFAHQPGKETPPKEEDYRSDDSLWLFNTIPAYVKETGDISFYNKKLPYADKGKDTVLGHMKQALRFNLERTGAHGLPCGLFADWNDCLELGHNGESLFVAFQLRYGLKIYMDICQMLSKLEEVRWARQQLETLDENINKHGWDGEWFLRAFRYDGLTFGSRDNEEGKIFLNSQTWAVLCDHADQAKAERAMRAVNQHLASEYGIMLCEPFAKTDFTVVKATLYNKGMKENGAIFCHAQGWAIMAETMLGNGYRAYRYLQAFLPAAYNDRAEIREVEPYVYCQTTHGKPSPRYGASRLPWLTGTAAWAYYSTMHCILGIQPDYNGLKIDPCIPSHWKGFSVRRVFRNKVLDIKVLNELGVQKGVKKLILNNETIDGNFIPFNKMKEENDVQVFME